jgi:hypothetical protein
MAEQRGVEVGHALGQQVVEAGEEGVRVAGLGCSAAIPAFEGLEGGLALRQGLGLEHRDAPLGALKRHGGGEARHAASDDQDVVVCRLQGATPPGAVRRAQRRTGGIIQGTALRSGRARWTKTTVPSAFPGAGRTAR